MTLQSSAGYSGLEMSGYKPDSVGKKYSFIHTILHRNNKSFLSRLQWLCSYTGSHLHKPWKLHCVPLYGLNSPSAFDFRASVGTFLFSTLQRQKLCIYCLLCQRHLLKMTKLGTNTFQDLIVFNFRNLHFNELNFCSTHLETVILC